MNKIWYFYHFTLVYAILTENVNNHYRIQMVTLPHTCLERCIPFICWKMHHRLLKYIQSKPFMDLEVFSHSLRSFHRSQWEISLPFTYFSHEGKRGRPTLSYIWIPKKVPLSGRAFRRAFSLDPTDCPWVSEDAPYRPLLVFKNSISNLAFSLILRRSFQPCWRIFPNLSFSEKLEKPWIMST